MVHKALSGLTAVEALTEEDFVYIVRGGNSRRVRLGDLGVPFRDFDTKAAVEAANIPSVRQSLRTGGYGTAGDGGGALYKRAASEPAHDGKIQSADGAWWEIAGTEGRPEQFGAIGDGSTDDTVAIQSALDVF